MIASKKFSFYLSTLLCLSPLITNQAHAIIGQWRNTNPDGTPWNTPSAWFNFPPNANAYPGQTTTGGDIAVFPQGLLASSVRSPSQPNIYVGTLSLNVGVGRAFQVGPNIIHFLGDASNPTANVNLTSGFIELGLGAPVGTIMLPDSPLFINTRSAIPGGSSLTMRGTFQTIGRPVTFNLRPEVGVTFAGNASGPSPYFVSNGTLTLAAPGTAVAVPGNITANPGGIILIGNGVSNTQFLLTRTNVTLNRGTLNLNGSTGQRFNTLTMFEGGTVINGAGGPSTLRLLNGDTPIRMKEGTIAISNLILQEGGTIAYDASLEGTGHAVLGANDQRMTLDLNGHDVTLAVESGSDAAGNPFDMEFINVDAINGSLTKTLPGRLLLAGNNTISSLSLNAGELIIGRTPGEFTTLGNTIFTVNAGTRLEGFGTLNSTAPNFLVRNSSLVEPGNAAQLGTLTIQGSYLQDPASALLIRAFNRTTSHLIVTNGGVALNGALIVTGTNVNFRNGDRVVVIDNSLGTGISGSFSGFFENITNDLLAKYVITPNQVLLEFFNSPEPEIGAAETAEITLVEGHILNVLSRLRAVRYRSEDYELEPPPAFQTEAEHPRKTISLRKTRTEIYEHIADAEAQEQITAGRFWKKPSDTPASVYIAPLGSWGRVDKINVQEGYKFDSIGGLIGADYAFDRAGVGLFLGYEGLHGTVENTFGTFRLKSAFGELYGTFLPLKNRNLFIDLILGGSRNWYTFNRQSSCFVATGTPKGWEYDAYAGIGYDFNIKKEWRFTPIFGFQYINTSINEFTEDGAFDENLNVGSQRMHSSRTWLGASFGGKLNRNKVVWMPQVRGFWLHEFAPLSHCLTVTSPCYCFCENLRIFTGVRNYGIAGGELRALFGARYNWSLAASYDYLWSNSNHTNYLYGELGYNF
jgi:outer membrane autotransporter protein